MPPSSACPHELRAGTVVCLYCRRAERERAQAELIRRGARYLAAALAVVLVAGGTVAGISRFGRVERPLASRPAALTLAEAPVAATVQSAGRPGADGTTASTPVDDSERGQAAAAPMPVAPSAATAASRPPLVAPAFRVAEGSTDLGEGITAIRDGDTVRVHFDTPLARTRRPEKFERVVRSTLPTLLDAADQPSLGELPQGAIAAAGDLISELPVRGVRLPLDSGRALMIWPETRPGRDGPLVVTYRVALAR